MDTNIEASLCDHLYLSYKSAMEGLQIHSSLPNEDSPVGVAIFGLGRIGTIHLNNLRRNLRARIIYIVEESTERVNYILNKYKLTEPNTTFVKPSQQSRVFQDNRVEAVVVCTPTFMHEELVIKALETGKAVFCEKPLALTDEGIQRCLAAKKKYSKPLLCAFNRRFDPGFRSIKARVDAGEIGKVHMIKTCSRDSPKPSTDYLKISGGIFHDCAVHDIDYICWVLGEYPISVSAYAHAYFEDIKNLGDYDTVGIMMKFPSGTIATIDLSRYAIYGYDQRVEVFGPKGMLSCGQHRPTDVQNHTEKGSTAVPIYYSFASRYSEAYASEMEHFLDVVQGKETCELNPESVVAISKIASACESVVNTGISATLSWEPVKKTEENI